MSRAIQELTQEAHEILRNINQKARDGIITAGQRDELIRIVLADVWNSVSIAKAADLFYAWTGEYPTAV